MVCGAMEMFSLVCYLLVHAGVVRWLLSLRFKGSFVSKALNVDTLFFTSLCDVVKVAQPFCGDTVYMWIYG